MCWFAVSNLTILCDVSLGGSESGESEDGLIIILDGSLASRSADLGRGSCNTLLHESLGARLVAVLLHLIEQARHGATTLVHVDRIVLLGSLVRNDLEVGRAVRRLAVSLLLLNFHLLVLLRENFFILEVPCVLRFSLLLGLLLSEGLRLHLSLLIRLLFGFVGGLSLLLLLLKGLLRGLALGDGLAERKHIGQRSVVILQVLQAIVGLLSDLNSFLG